VALRTQQVMADESGVVNTIDPLGGSYFVEALTDRMERDALSYIRRIEELGGVVAAIESGFQQKEIADAAYKYQRQTDSGDKTIVGLNKYTMQNERRPEILKIGAEVEQRQVERVAELRESRDQARVDQALALLRRGAENDTNLLPLMLDAVRAYATVGEVCEALVPVFGTYRETSVL
jgi:methylmalonyl-CoA mutase N-terminal domain/subunit